MLCFSTVFNARTFAEYSKAINEILFVKYPADGDVYKFMMMQFYQIQRNHPVPVSSLREFIFEKSIGSIVEGRYLDSYKKYVDKIIRKAFEVS